MLLDLIGALAAGLGLLGLVLLVNRVLLRGRIGRWIYPATVALGMVSYTIWAEYTWAERTITAMPQLELARESGSPAFYRPWSYVFPRTTRMIAIDRSQTRTHPDQPGLVMTRIVLIGRWEPIRAVTVVYDCRAPARADLIEGVSLNADGTLEGATWVPVEAEDAVLAAACAAQEGGSDEPANGA